MAIADCLKTSVGLTTQDCACLETGRPEDYDQSLSGYYIDDMEHSVPLIYPSAATDCGDGSVWDLLKRARTSGINDFLEKMSIAIGNNKTKNHREYLGWLGDEKNNAFTDTNMLKTIVGIRIKPYAIRGGVFRVQKLSLIIGQIGTYTIKIHNITNGYEAASPVVSKAVEVISANKHTEVSLDAETELPMTVEGVPQEYVITYEPDGARPRNTQFSCGCSGASKRRGWMSYFDSYYGFAAANDEEVYTPKLTTSQTYGLRVYGNIECDGSAFICSDQMDYDRTDYSRVIAKTIQLCAINKLLHGIMSSANINRYTKMSGELLLSKMDRNNSEIANRIQWLSLNIPDSLTDCYSCKKSTVMGTIRAS